MSTTPPDRLLELFEAGDLEELDQYLSGLDQDERTVVRRWFQNGRPWFRDIRNDFESVWWPDRYWVLPWCEALGAVALLGPVTAAKRVPWANLSSHVDHPGSDLVLHRLQNAEVSWVSEFVNTAAVLPLSRDRGGHNYVTRWLRAAVARHDLPCPSGSTFLVSCWSGPPTTPANRRDLRKPLPSWPIRCGRTG